jgi:TolA-binding protein
MSRSFALVTLLFFSAALAGLSSSPTCAQQAAAPAPAPAPESTPTSNTVTRSAPDKPVDPKLVANLRQRALGLQQQLDVVDKELSDLKNFSKGDTKGSGGLKSSMDYSYASVGDQLRALTQKKSQIQAALDAVFDAARAKGIEPGQLR